MDDHHDAEETTWTAYFVVFIVPGLMLAGLLGRSGSGGLQSARSPTSA